MGFASCVSGQTAVGRYLRLPLRLVPKSAVVRVLSGPLRGSRWIVGSSTHGCWMGSRERNKLWRFSALVDPGAVVYDVGAHVGQYTLAASQRVGPDGRVLAIEPFPRNLKMLRRNLAINRVANTFIVEAAASNARGVGQFREGPSVEASMGHLAPGGEIEVAMVRIDDIVAAGYPAPDVVKMDIEGGEGEALLGMRETLHSFHPTIFLATHGEHVHDECVALLESMGYAFEVLGSPDELLAIAGPAESGKG